MAVDNVVMDVPMNWVILGKTVFDIFEEPISCRTNEHDESYPSVHLKTIEAFLSDVRWRKRAKKFEVGVSQPPFCRLRTFEPNQAQNLYEISTNQK